MPENTTLAEYHASRIIDRWHTYRRPILRALIVLMIIAAGIWLSYQFWRLTIYQGEMGAIDLKQRYEEVHLWLAGKPVYDLAESPTYPPASLLMLSPLLGWLDEQPARWLWAATSFMSLVWLAHVLLSQSGAEEPLTRRFITLMPFATYPAGATIGNGQLIVHVLPALLTGVLLLGKADARWRNDIAASVLVLIALIKPNVSAPFLWMVLFCPGRLRPALLVAGGYLLMTLTAAYVNGAAPVSMVWEWLQVSQGTAEWASVVHDRASVHGLLYLLGLQKWNPLASLFILCVLGGWVFRHRRTDLWLLLGVTAVVARFWTYHGWYDDLLILISMIALFRVADTPSSRPRNRVAAGALLGLALFSLMAPGGRYLLPAPWDTVWIFTQLFVWTVIMGFLVRLAPRFHPPRMVAGGVISEESTR